MKRRNIVEINNEHIVLNSQKEFSDFKKRYNKYDFMQKEQNNVWEVKLKEPKPYHISEPTNREIMTMLLEMKRDFEARFEKQEEFNRMVLEIFKRNDLKLNSIIELNNLKTK